MRNRGEPATPAVLYAEHLHTTGETWSLALTRTRWRDEGALVLEQTDAEGHIELIEPGAWFIRHPDEGPATLKVEFQIDEEVDHEVLGILLDKLVAAGSSWGIEAREAVS